MKDRIIFVEDDEDQQELGRRHLARLLPEADIIICGTMDEVAKALSAPPSPLGIITDNGFPMTENSGRIGGESIEGGAGMILIKSIRTGEYGEDLKSIPIVLCSANLTPMKSRKATQLGGSTISIVKETDYSHLAKAVHYIQDIRHSEHQKSKGLV